MRKAVERGLKWITEKCRKCIALSSLFTLHLYYSRSIYITVYPSHPTSIFIHSYLVSRRTAMIDRQILLLRMYENWWTWLLHCAYWKGKRNREYIAKVGLVNTYGKYITRQQELQDRNGVCAEISWIWLHIIRTIL